jgi:hypothetical protein
MLGSITKWVDMYVDRSGGGGRGEATVLEPLES